MRRYVTRAAVPAVLIGLVGAAHGGPLQGLAAGVPAVAGPSPSVENLGEASRAPSFAPESTTPGSSRWFEGWDLRPPWLCEYSSDCIDDYLVFPTLALEHASLLSVEEVAADVRRAAAAPVRKEHPRPEVLQAIVRDAVGTSFLFDGVDSVPLQVTRLASVETPQWRQDHLLVQDPWIGALPVRVLAPPGVDITRPESSRPVLLFVSGHLDTADSLLEEYDGQGFVDAGYVVVTIESRADDSGPVEDWASRYLLVNGFTLMGIRMYEALIVLRLLRDARGVDPTRIGLLGHSGGSSVVNTLVRLHPSGVAAAVSDHHSDYYNHADERYTLCELVPELVPWSVSLSDPSTAPMPMKRVDYGWPGGARTVTRFFDRYLGPVSPGGSAE